MVIGVFGVGVEGGFWGNSGVCKKPFLRTAMADKCKATTFLGCDGRRHAIRLQTCKEQLRIHPQPERHQGPRCFQEPNDTFLSGMGFVWGGFGGWVLVEFWGV